MSSISSQSVLESAPMNVETCETESPLAAEDAVERLIVGHVYDNGEYTIFKQHLGLFPMEGRDNELRLRQDKSTRNARRSARAKFMRDTAKLSGADDDDLPAHPHFGGKCPRSYATAEAQ